jgi:hypothetical protein
MHVCEATSVVMPEHQTMSQPTYTLNAVSELWGATARIAQTCSTPQCSTGSLPTWC